MDPQHRMTRKLRALRLVAVALATAATSLATHAAEMNLSACTFDAEPVIANGTAASQEQMTATAAAVRGYMGAMQDSLACLERAEKELGAEITDEQKLTITAAYNSGVDKLNTIANAYNEQVRAFKNR